MTFIKQLSGEDYSQCRSAVLIGQYVKAENNRNIFISGAIEVEGIDTAGDITFSNDTWTDIYEKIKKYFVDMEIVGWFLGGPGYLLEDEEKILKAHIDNFAGQDKTLITYDNMEKEEAFLIFDNNRLVKQEGYYIYYEKNEEMQTYMVDHKKTKKDEEHYEDRVTKEIRNVIQNKKPASQEENKGVTVLMYAAGTLLAVIVLIVGAAMLNNYEQMKNMQDTLNTLTQKNVGNEPVTNIPTQAINKEPEKNLPEETKKQAEPSNSDEESSDEGSSDEGSLDVEVVPGNVAPIEKEEEDNKKAPGEELTGESSKKPDTKKSDEKVAEKKKNKEKKNDKEPAKEVLQEEVKYYTVKIGDTLAGISYKLYNSANYITKIMELNNIEDEDVIFAGQRLIVP
jgi:LysM repeat protein